MTSLDDYMAQAFGSAQRLPASLFAPLMRDANAGKNPNRSDYVYSEEPQMVRVGNALRIDDDAMRADPGLAALQSKFGSAEEMGDGRISVNMQQPGQDKYSLMNAVYRIDPATGDYVMDGAPTNYRQQSSMTAGLQTLGKAATPFLAAIGGPALASALGGGMLGGAAAGAAVGAGGSAISGGNSEANLRAGVIGGLTAGAMKGAESAGWLPGGDLPSGMDLAADGGLNSIDAAASQFSSGFQPMPMMDVPQFNPDDLFKGMADPTKALEPLGDVFQMPGEMPSPMAPAVMPQADPYAQSVDITAPKLPFDPMPQFNISPGEFGQPLELTNPIGGFPGTDGGGFDPSMSRIFPPAVSQAPSAGGFRPSENYGDGLSGKQTTAYDSVIDATGSPTLANTASQAVGAGGPMMDWIKANPKLAARLFTAAGGLLGGAGASTGGGGGQTVSGPAKQWTSALQMGGQSQPWKPTMNNPAAIQARSPYGAGRYFGGT